MPNHRDLPEDQLHEPKGIKDASLGDVVVADGLGGSRVEGASRVGFGYYVHDSSNPYQSIPAGLGTKTQLQNLADGANTNTLYLNGFPPTWNGGTHRLNTDFLFLGDFVEATFTIEYAGTSVGQDVELGMVFDVGGLYEFTAESFKVPNLSTRERTITVSIPVLAAPPIVGGGYFWCSSSAAMNVRMKDLIVKTTRCTLQGSI